MSENKTEKKLAIIMLGAPGSGKGTQSEYLEKNTGFKRFVMSDLIKKELQPGTELHRKIFKEGVLLGDKDVFQIFRKYFKGKQNVIIDGLPRTLDQAYWLYGYLMNHQYEIQLVFLNVNEKKLVKRITSRYYCPKCHKGYNTIVLPPKTKGLCDDCNEKLIQRDDDTKETFSDRLKTFDKVKKVILNVYKGEVIEVNGDQEIEKVSQDLMREIITR